MTNDPLVEIQENGYCLLRNRFSRDLISACREGFWRILLDYLDDHRETPNRGPHRHFLPMPFTPPCFAPEFFFDNEVLASSAQPWTIEWSLINGAAMRLFGVPPINLPTSIINGRFSPSFPTWLSRPTCSSSASAWFL
jgi:hypothetical protein